MELNGASKIWKSLGRVWWDFMTLHGKKLVAVHDLPQCLVSIAWTLRAKDACLFARNRAFGKSCAVRGAVLEAVDFHCSLTVSTCGTQYISRAKQPHWHRSTSCRTNCHVCFLKWDVFCAREYMQCSNSGECISFLFCNFFLRLILLGMFVLMWVTFLRHKFRWGFQQCKRNLAFS